MRKFLLPASPSLWKPIFIHYRIHNEPHPFPHFPEDIMTDTPQTEPQQPQDTQTATESTVSPQASTAEQPPSASLVDELNRLGQNFAQLIKEALESPQLQEVRKEITTGAQTVIEEINERIVQARESQVTQEVAQKAAKTVEEIKSSPVTENVKLGLLNTLRTVNQELNELIQKLDQTAQPQEPSSSQAPSPQEESEPAPQEPEETATPATSSDAPPAPEA